MKGVDSRLAVLHEQDQQKQGILTKMTDAISAHSALLNKNIAQTAHLSVKIDENLANEQRRAETMNAQQPLTQNALQAESPEEAGQFAFTPAPHQSNFKPGTQMGRGGPPTFRTPPNTNLGRGSAPETPKRQNPNMINPQFPFPFCMRQTNYQSLDSDAKAGLKAKTGIDSDTHPLWNTMDVSKFPGEVCPCCAGRNCTPGYCKRLWSQSAEAQGKEGSVDYAQRQKRLLSWNLDSDRPTTLAPLSENLTLDAMCQFIEEAEAIRPPCLIAALTQLSQAPEAQPILNQHTAMLRAIDYSLHYDGGDKAIDVARELGDPRGGATGMQ